MANKTSFTVAVLYHFLKFRNMTVEFLELCMKLFEASAFYTVFGAGVWVMLFMAGKFGQRAMLRHMSAIIRQSKEI